MAMNVLFILLLLYSSIVMSFDAIWEQTTTVKSLEPKRINQYQKDPIKINLNVADKNLLQQLEGVGPKKAQAIIDYRHQKGPFKSVQDLLKIKGFSEKMLEKLLSKNDSLLVVD
jgi:comEA protein